VRFGFGVRSVLVLYIAQTAMLLPTAKDALVLTKYSRPPFPRAKLAPGGVIAGWMANSNPVVNGSTNR